jgi:hypothetical protein
MAAAAIAGWRFHEPVTVITASELQELAYRRQTVFTGRPSELDVLRG